MSVTNYKRLIYIYSRIFRFYSVFVWFRKKEEKNKKKILKFVMFMMHYGQTSTYKPERKFQRSITMPLGRGKESLDLDVDSLEQLIEKNGW